MKQQVLVIHGGNTFDNYEGYLEYLKNYEVKYEKLTTRFWKERLPEDLGNQYEVILAKMPNSMNAKYSEWEIMMGKITPFLREGVTLVGHSLGGIFLAKYLSENDFPQQIKATFLVAAPFQDKDSEYSLGDFRLPENLNRFASQAGKIVLYQSEDDPVVPYADVEGYKKLLPEAEIVAFKDRGHFSQEHFPELVDLIKKES